MTMGTLDRVQGRRDLAQSARDECANRIAICGLQGEIPDQKLIRNCEDHPLSAGQGQFDDCTRKSVAILASSIRSTLIESAQRTISDESIPPFGQIPCEPQTGVHQITKFRKPSLAI
jgi:hypothetical protein